MSNSAGVATLAADACAPRGLEVADASKEQNPMLLGISAGPEDYAASIRELLGDAGIDALMVFYIEFYDGDPQGVLDAISAVSEGQPKPVVASVLRSDGRLPARTGLGVPNFLIPRVVRRRARSRGGTPRMAITAARRAAALPRPGRPGGASGDLFIS